MSRHRQGSKLPAGEVPIKAAFYKSSSGPRKRYGGLLASKDEITNYLDKITNYLRMNKLLCVHNYLFSARDYNYVYIITYHCT